MLGWIKEYKRKKLLKSCTSREIQTDFINLGDISSLGFVYALTSQESVKDLMEIYRLLKAKGIPFKGLVIEGRKKFLDKGTQQGNADLEELMQSVFLQFVPYEKLNWIGVVAPDQVEEFFKSQTDVFISFNQTGCFTLDYIIAAYVDSPVRIGMENTPNIPYSMVVEGQDKTYLEPIEYLEQIFHYLNIIKTK